MTQGTRYNRATVTRLILALGSNSTLPSYRYSQLDRGIVECAKLYGNKLAADYALVVGISLKSAIKLLMIAGRG